ncbi:c-type cytochrome [Anianabacter salinae]|uniref:c-type cytochrome n=1 Tax=Anianabacter salinae TaxID=2851023 RepID=UPI00225E08A5|nr:c-type cytochrome [Anianabacter salinae]MBV0912777.1 c-type cytochrome [Anianabacter salinae]
MSKFLKLFAPTATGAAAVLGSAYFLADQLVTDMPAPARGEIVSAAVADTETQATTDQASAPVQLASAAPARDGGFGLGRPATEDEVRAWDVKVMPDGRGLPVGSGSVADGETLFSDNCAACHGEFAEGAGNWPKLAGGDGSLANDDPVKTVGSYWPYLSTVYDYVHRSMPFGNAQILTPDETYAITAYILYSNFLVEDDFVLSNENFLEVEMPNAGGFIVDDRPETEYPLWRAEPCMEACKTSVEITMRATVLDVTPDVEGDEVAAETVAAAPAETAAPAEAETAIAEAPAQDAVGPDPALVAAGETVFRKCSSCHQVGDGAKNRTGPHLNDLFGRTMGGIEGFKYSGVFQEARDAGRVWDEASLAEFLAKPREYMSGTKMSFAGFRDDQDTDAVLAYLKTFDSGE